MLYFNHEERTALKIIKELYGGNHMKNERIIEGLNTVIEGLTVLRDELAGEEVVREAPKSRSVSRREKAQTEEPMNKPEETEAPATVTGKFSKEQLDSMKYNELKKLGASLGVPCTGKRDEITARILALDVEVTAEPTEEGDEGTAEEENKVVPIDKAKKGGLKKSKKTEEVIPQEFVDKAKEIAEETDVEEIAEVLADVGIKAKGKKSDIVMLLAKALSDGLIDIDDEDEEESEEEVEETEAEESEVAEDESEDGAEFSADSYFEEYDPDGVNNPDNMTEERAEAVHAMMEETIEAIENEQITEEDISTFCENTCTQDELDQLGDDYEFEDLVALYLETKKRMIDDEGNTNEPGEPYEINEENYCCGHALKYDNKGKVFICEVCGNKYEAK
jgi:hypothetical protein